MKKYCLIIILSVLFLCGCEEKKPPEYVYHDHTPLTTVTTVTTVPVDTYSEYMETYTPPSTTGTDVYYYYLPPTFSKGTGNAVRDAMPPFEKPQPDTVISPNVSADTRPPAVTTIPTENKNEETSVPLSTIAFSRPEKDVIETVTVTADTAPSRYVAETTADTALPTE